jgi:hypothetical protein
MKRFFLSLLFLCSALGADYYPDASRFASYSAGVKQGVVGGIPTRAGANVINVATYGWDSGASAATNAAAFASAMAASSEGDIISIPAGTFDATQLVVSWTHINRTIRGAGMTAWHYPRLKSHHCF